MPRAVAKFAHKSYNVSKAHIKRVFIYEPNTMILAQLDEAFREAGFSVYSEANGDNTRARMALLAHSNLSLDAIILYYDETSLVCKGLIKFATEAFPVADITVKVADSFNAEDLPESVFIVRENQLDNGIKEVTNRLGNSRASLKEAQIKQREVDKVKTNEKALQNIREKKRGISKEKIKELIEFSEKERLQIAKKKIIQDDLMSILNCGDKRTRRFQWRDWKHKAKIFGVNYSYNEISKIMRQMRKELYKNNV